MNPIFHILVCGGTGFIEHFFCNHSPICIIISHCAPVAHVELIPIVIFLCTYVLSYLIRNAYRVSTICSLATPQLEAVRNAAIHTIMSKLLLLDNVMSGQRQWFCVFYLNNSSWNWKTFGQICWTSSPESGQAWLVSTVF